MGYVWDRTVETLGERASVIAPIAVLGIFLPAAVLASLQGLGLANAGAKLALTVASLLISLLSLWAQLAITAAAVDTRAGTGAAARTGVRRLLPAIGVFLLVGLAATIVLLPVVILLAAGGVDAAAMQTGQVQLARLRPGMVGAASLYGLVAGIALLFVFARLTTLTSVVVAERRGAGAIARAFRLTKGLTWRLVGVLILYGIVATVATMAVRTVFGTILKLFDGSTGPVTITGVVTAIATSAVSTVFSVLATVFCARLYVAMTGGAGGAVVGTAVSDQGTPS